MLCARCERISILLSGGAPTATLSANSLAFGNQNAGVASVAQQIVLTNSGSSPLVLTGMVISGQNSPDFTQTNNCGTLPASFAAGPTCAVKIIFDPSATGTEGATLTFTPN